MMISSASSVLVQEKEWLASILRRIYTPREPLDVRRWIRDRRPKLSTEESQEHSGIYDPSFTPYVDLIFEFFEDPHARELFIQKSSQLGITLAVLIACLARYEWAPANLIYCIDSREEMRKISKARLQPLLKSLGIIGEENENEQENLTLYLLGAVWYLLGSYSAGALSNKTATIGVLDEFNKHPVLETGTTLDAMRSRLKAVKNSKLIGFCTPTTPKGAITVEAKAGDGRKLFLPCPHCDHLQPLERKNLRFSHCKDLAGGWDLERVLTDTYIECECCHKPIRESDKKRMFVSPERQWVRTNPTALKSKWSAYLNDLYSPFDSVSWGKLALRLIDAEGDPVKLAAVINENFGEEYAHGGAALSDDLVLSCRLPQMLKGGVIPLIPISMVLTVDVQFDFFKWVRVAYGSRGDIYVHDYGEALTYEQLMIIADDPVTCADGASRCCEFGLIDDGGNRTQETRRWVRDIAAPRFFSCKGRGGIQLHRLAGQVEGTHTLIDGIPIMLYLFDDDAYKKRLSQMIGNRERLIKYNKPVLYLPHDVEDRFVAELLSEQLKRTFDKKGWVKEEWVKDRAVPNDFADALKMSLIVWDLSRGTLLPRGVDFDTRERWIYPAAPAPV